MSDERPETHASWGFPRFARSFPRHGELDALVAAYAAGDYRTVRERAPRLAETAEDEEVRRAARVLRERIEPDPTAKLLFLIAAALLVFLSAYWIMHDGPPSEAPLPAPTAPAR